jgi:hypothetical protein
MPGSQGFTEEDRAYTGSTFREVREAVFDNPYYAVWGNAGEAPLPHHPVTLWSLLTGILSFGRRFQFLQAARRTVTSSADLRWGPDRRGVRRLVHPNGVCLTGRWEITEPTGYSGYFAQGSVGLLIGRYSTCCTETRRGRTRSLSLVGKVYPTTDPDSSDRVRPASFFTQQDIGGERIEYINDAELRNAPDTRLWRRGLGAPVLMLTGFVFALTDKEVANRQLYEIAELGKPAGEPTRAPEFLRLLVAADQPYIDGADLDFRDEVLAQIYGKGVVEPQRKLVFNMEVSDEGTTKGPAFYQRRAITNWRRIGRLVFREAVASYNGDCVIHFHHPPWRNDRNNPLSVARPQNDPAL